MTIGINQTVSPIKFCFLIEPDSEKSFEKAVKIAFSHWGGIFSPILPFYTELPEDFINEYNIIHDTKSFYMNCIENYDPDIIIFDDSLNSEFINTLIGDRTLLSIENVFNDLEKGMNKYGIILPKLISHIIENEFKFVRNDDLKLMIPDTRDSGLFLKSFIGCFLDEYHDEISTDLKSHNYFEEPKLTFDNIANYFPNDNISTLDINIEKINFFTQRSWFRGEGIYFLNETRLRDIINFWNLRALGWSIVPVPISQIDNLYFSEFIERFSQSQLNNSMKYTIITFLTSTTVTIEQKNGIEQKLQNIKNKIGKNLTFGLQDWFPRFWENERSILEADKVLCRKAQINSTYSQVEVQENFVKFKADNLPFKFENNYLFKASHKINLTFSYFDDYVEDAGLIYGIETIDWMRLTHSFYKDKWLLSKTGLCYYVRREDEEISFFIPKARDFFKVFFSKSGNKLVETSNGRLANEVLKNIGGIRGSYFLQKKSSLKILELIEGGKNVHHQQLVAEIKRSLKNKKNEEIYSYIKSIIDNKIIEFGSILQCEVCHQHSFYLPSDLKETMICSTCRNTFSLPMHQPSEIKWAYRGIGPFSKNNKVGGIITVFLTLKLFNQQFAFNLSNMSALIGFELKKDKNVKEVDLAVMLENEDKESIPPDLIFCECKTYKNFTSVDADRMIELGTEFPNSILTFATLNDDLTEDEQAEILRVVNHFRIGFGQRPKNPVLILTAKELLPNDYSGHFSEYEKKSKLYHRYNDWIGNLCDFSVEKYLRIKTWGEIVGEKWEEAMKDRNDAKQNSKA